MLGSISRTGGWGEGRKERKREGERARNNVCHMVALSNFSNAHVYTTLNLILYFKLKGKKRKTECPMLPSQCYLTCKKPLFGMVSEKI